MTQGTDSDRLAKMEVQLEHSNEMLRELKELLFSVRDQLQQHNNELGKIITQDENTRKRVDDHDARLKDLDARLKDLEDKFSSQAGSFNMLRLIAGLVFTVLVSVAGWSILETIEQKSIAEVQKSRIDELYRRVEAQESKP